MGIWRRVGRIGWLAAKGSWRLHQASGRADALASASAARPTPRDHEVDPRLTSGQAALLARYVAATFVLSWLELFFLLKYLILVGGVILLRVDGFQAAGVALIVLFGLAAIVQWLVTRLIRRFGAIDRLRELDDIVAVGSTAWWPNLRREMARLGMRPRPWMLLGSGAGRANGRRSGREQVALGQIDWLAVLPREEWRRARQVLARAAGAPPLPGPRPGPIDQPQQPDHSAQPEQPR
jgi:hypothetical protein